MNCGSCKATLPAGFEFKFCPFCGSVIEVKASSITDPYLQGDTKEELITSVAAEAETAFEIPAVKMEEPAAPKPRRKKKKKKKKRRAPVAPVAHTVGLQDKPTVVLTAVTPEMLTDMLSQDDAPAPKLWAETTRAEAPRPGDPGFSETAWFMAAVRPEQLAEAEGEALDYSEQEIMTDRYRVSEKLPDEVRKDFSLSYAKKKPRSRKKKKKR